MSATTSKLEMSLDEIIKAQKGKGQNQSIVKGRGGPVNKRRQIGTLKNKRQQLGGFIRKNQIKGKMVNTTLKKRVGVAPGRKPFSNRFVGIGKNTVGNAIMNSATNNLVKKLVKKAIAKNIATSLTPRGGKIMRIPTTRLRQRTIILNKVSNRSRAIRRRRIVAIQNSPILMQRQQPRNIRGRGPIRFAESQVMQAVQRAIALPKRRSQFVKQEPATMFIQQQPRAFKPAPQQVPSIREQINAMRRVNRVQQLNNQFLKQQQQQVVKVVQRQPRRQQVIAIQQQRRFPHRQRQQPQEVIILQQQAPQRRRQQRFNAVQQQSFRPGGQRRQQIVQVDPLYSPPNFLQRI